VRLRLAFELHKAGVDIKRQQLRRQHLQLDAAQAVTGRPPRSGIRMTTQKMYHPA